MHPTLMDLLQEAGRLKAAGQMEQALSLYRQTQRRFPTEPVAQHNLAATLGDLGRHDEALVFAKAALGAGLDAPETWLLRARFELGLLDLVSAAESYRRAPVLRPNLLAAQFEAPSICCRPDEHLVNHRYHSLNKGRARINDSRIRFN